LWLSPKRSIEAVIPGGHQERERRPGTENIAAIAGMGAAARGSNADAFAATVAIAAQLESALLSMNDVVITGGSVPRVGNTINARFAGCRGESIAMALDLDGVAVSTGAACTSGSVKPSKVLLALGLDVDTARSAVRFSLGRANTAADIDFVTSRLPRIVERARKFAR